MHNVRLEQEHRIMCFFTPFASPASVKHANKLIDCLLPSTKHMSLIGDKRLCVDARADMIEYYKIPTLHYVESKSPIIWSAFTWILKITWILLYSTFLVIRQRHKIDCVLCYRSPYYTPILLCAKLLGITTIIYIPLSNSESAKSVYLGKPGGNLLIYLLKLLQTINQYTADICVVQSLRLVERLGLHKHLSKVYVGTLYVDTDSYRIKQPFAERSTIIGFVGRLTDEKGIMQLLDAAMLLDNQEVSFQILGDGRLRNKVEKAIQNPKLAHTTLLGWGDSNCVIDKLNEWKLMVLPSFDEGVPNAVIEAMACGTPVLATDVDGIPDLINDNITGFILADRTPETISLAIKKSLEYPALEEIAQNANAFVNCNYSLEAAAERWQKILDIAKCTRKKKLTLPLPKRT